MKKIIMFAAAIFIIGVLGGGLFVYRVINKERTAITFEEFQAYTEQNGYEFQDNADLIPIDQIGKSGAANIQPYVQVEFFECRSEDVAKQLFANYRMLAEQFKGNGVKESSINLDHYGSYTMESSGTYMHMTRIGNTLMSARVEEEKKEIAGTVMKELGYLD